MTPTFGGQAGDFLHSLADVHESKPAATGRIGRPIEHRLRQFVAHSVEELVSLAERFVHLFERGKVHAAMCDVLPTTALTPTTAPRSSRTGV